MDAGDAATPGPPIAMTVMSADDERRLTWDKHWDEILADIGRKLENTNHGPAPHLGGKYSSDLGKHQCAQALWQEFPTHVLQPSSDGRRLAWPVNGARTSSCHNL